MAIMTVTKRKFVPSVLLHSRLRLSRSGAKVRSESGITLMEVMVATAVLVISTVGALSYQYHAARDTQIARAQITATRTAQLLLEDWMSTGGSEDYDPTDLGLGFVPTSDSLPEIDGLGHPLNNTLYSVKVDKQPMLVVLAWSDIAHDTESDVILRQLSAVVSFGSALNAASIDGAEPIEAESVEEKSGELRANQLKSIKPVILTTYIRLDAAGG